MNKSTTNSLRKRNNEPSGARTRVDTNATKIINQHRLGTGSQYIRFRIYAPINSVVLLHVNGLFSLALKINGKWIV
jgi:hypothetical protein